MPCDDPENCATNGAKPLCHCCAADLERGAWWTREGEAFVQQYKHDADAMGSIIAIALECRTLEEARIVLSLTAVEQPREQV